MAQLLLGMGQEWRSAGKRGAPTRLALQVLSRSVAVRMVLLSVGLCAVAILVLTVEGARSAKGGLNAKPETALQIEAQLSTEKLHAYRQLLLQEQLIP